MRKGEALLRTALEEKVAERTLELNGRQLADAVREQRPGLKVLFLTCYAESVAVGNGQMEGGMEVITKPFTLDALVAKVGGMIAC